MWYLCCVPNLVQILCYSHWDRRTYASDITSRELTSGFAFWSRGHRRIAMMHLPIKFSADIFIQSGVIDIFFEIQDGASRHLGLSGYVNLATPACWKCGICVLYQISFKYTLLSLRSTHLSFRSSFDDVTRINFGFDFWSRGHLRMAVMHLPIKSGADTFIKSRVIDILPKLKMALPSWICWGNHGTTHEGMFVVRTPCKYFVVIG